MKGKSRSIMQDRNECRCYICEHFCGDRSRKDTLEKHHVFGGPDRKKSETFGLTVYLCRKHHTGDISGVKEAVHHPEYNDYARRLQRDAQKKFELVYGSLMLSDEGYDMEDLPEDEVKRLAQSCGHTLFMREFGRSYL